MTWHHRQEGARQSDSDALLIRELLPGEFKDVLAIHEAAFGTPCPISAGVADAWMVLPLQPGLVGQGSGRVNCRAALDHPEYWVE